MMQPSPEQTFDNAQRSVTLFDFLQVFSKRRRLICGLTLAAAAASTACSFLLSDVYCAKTMILPAQEDKTMMSAMMGQLGGLANLAGGAGISLGGPTTADLYVSMLKSEAIKDPIIDRFKLTEVYGDKNRSAAYKSLDRNIRIAAGKKDGIITVLVDDKDRNRAADMANAYVEELGKLAVRLNVTGAGQNRRFLEERLNTAKADLARAEEALKRFQSANKAVQVTAQAEASIKGIAELRAQLASREVQLATYRRKFTESRQEVKNLVTTVANLKGQIANLEGDGGANSSIPSVGSVPAIAQEYLRHMREFKIQETLVEMLTKQYEMATLAEAKEVSPFQVILKAKVPEEKSEPARSKIVLTATFCAFFLSLLLALLKENLSRMDEAARQRWRDLFKTRG
jgi:tyrosine-protein kinase Etk/Wzc